MPSAIVRRDMSTLRSWRDPKIFSQQRQASTAQESLRPSEDPRASAVLHGPKGAAAHSQRHVNQKRSSNQTPPPNSASQPQHWQQPNSQPDSVSRLSSNGTRHSMPRRGKRERETQIDGDPRSARRRRLEPTSAGGLKDATYIRRTMHVPTREEYPKLPAKLFTNPKEQLHNALHGLGAFQVQYARIGNNVHRCALSCNLAPSEPSEVVSGEGGSKVGVCSITWRATSDNL